MSYFLFSFFVKNEKWNLETHISIFSVTLKRIQQCAIFQTPGKKCVPSALNWNDWSYIVNDKSCSATVQNVPSKKNAPKENPINVDPPWGSFTKTILRISFKWRCSFSCTYDFFRTATFYEKLLLHSKHFCIAATSPE